MTDINIPELPEGYFWYIQPDVVGIYRELPDTPFERRNHLLHPKYSRDRTFKFASIHSGQWFLRPRVYTAIVVRDQIAFKDQADLVIERYYRETSLIDLNIQYELRSIQSELRAKEKRAKLVEELSGIWDHQGRRVQ